MLGFIDDLRPVRREGGREEGRERGREEVQRTSNWHQHSQYKRAGLLVILADSSSCSSFHPPSLPPSLPPYHLHILARF